MRRRRLDTPRRRSSAQRASTALDDCQCTAARRQCAMQDTTFVPPRREAAGIVLYSQTSQHVATVPLSRARAHSMVASRSCLATAPAPSQSAHMGATQASSRRRVGRVRVALKVASPCVHVGVTVATLSGTPSPAPLAAHSLEPRDVRSSASPVAANRFSLTWRRGRCARTDAWETPYGSRRRVERLKSGSLLHACSDYRALR